MRQFKDSGIEWIGKIPENWALSRLKYVLDSPIETGKRPNEPEGKVLSIGGEHIQNGNFDLSHPMYVTETTYSENKGKIVPHDTLVVKDGATIGKCMYVSSMPCEKMLLNEHVYRVNCSKFYYYWILSDISQKWFRVRNQSTAQESITGPTIMNLPVVSLDIEVQNRIADYLDEKCGEIDSLITLQEQMIEKLKAYKQSVITEAVTKGLDPNAKLVPSGIDWIGDIPEGWKVAKAKYFVSITNGSDPKTEGNIPVYGSGAGSFKTCGEYKIGPTVLIGRKGATLHIPHYLEGKYWNVDTAFDVKVKSNMDLRYYYYLAICFDYKLYISQTTLPGMAQSSYYNMNLPIPPLSEQQAIASYLDEKCADIDRLIALKQQKIEALKDYKKSVIYEAVTGKTDLRDN